MNLERLKLNLMCTSMALKVCGPRDYNLKYVSTYIFNALSQDFVDSESGVYKLTS